MVRVYKRKIYKRKRSALSNYKIATKTSAKAQSKQIYALKKRVNTIYRMNRPEIRVQQRLGSGAAFQTTTSGVFNFDTVAGGTVSSAIIPQLGTVVSADTGSAPINNFARLRSFSFYGMLQYNAMSATSKPVTLRIVIVQTKTTRSDNVTDTDIFSSGTDTNSGFQRVYGPLQVGLSRTCKVLSDKRYVLSYQKPNVTIRTNLKYLLNYYRDQASSSGGSSESVAKGTIYVAYAVFGSGLADSPALTVNSYKLAFIDN